MYCIDTFFVGVTFYAIKERYHWNISIRNRMIILFIIFAFLENYILPMVIALDITYTIRNPVVAKILDFKPNEPFADLFDIGLFELVTWLVQSFLANYIGEKLMIKKPKQAV